MNSATRTLRLIINGKSAGDPALRAAVEQIREVGHKLDVRVTWEAGDAKRYAEEAVNEGIDVVIAGGGDGTINEVAGGMLSATQSLSTALAVVPYGTANDFATGIGVLKDDPLTALQLAAHGEATPIDIGRVNGRVFVNVTSGGFGAEVTANTPVQLKKVLGGVAYSLMGVVTAARMNPIECRFTLPDGTIHEGSLLLMAVGNGRQCGGGYQVTPHAFLNDGLLDVIIVHDADIPHFGSVLSELQDVTNRDNRYVAYEQVTSFSIESSRPLQLSLDGEPYRDTSFKFDLLPKALPFILGPAAPLKPASNP